MGDAAPRPLVVVSNRLPFEVHREGSSVTFSRAPGGLVTALSGALAARGGEWIGWPGIEQEGDEALPPLPETDGIKCRPVSLSAQELLEYYAGFSNATLWPLFHYFTTNTRIDATTWHAYEKVNERFAQVAAASNADALVWIHDYQLMRVPALLRALDPQRRIGFFLHIPFPASPVFRILPWSRQLMAGLLGADLIGFHVREFAENFLDCAERLLGCEIDRDAGRIQYQGRTVAVQAHPISIDAALQERMARAAGPKKGKIQQILGVDRLDYTKGICERILAIEQLLERRPDYHGKLEFTQIVVPSRERVDEYQALKREIDEMVGRVNGKFSDPRWTPIRYLFGAFPAEEVAAMYRHADVGLVTPLRDGMNLVAKEYVASQVDDDGVLVLSELAGSAAELPEALIVNPYDVEAVTDALERALEMQPDERQTRMKVLRNRVQTMDVNTWATRFLTAAEEAAEHRAGVTTPVEMARRRLTGWLKARPQTALFLDYDGTLRSVAVRLDEAQLDEEARRVLEQAVRATDVNVTIVTGRDVADARALIGVDGLTIAGNHGYEIDGPGLTYWHAPADAFQKRLDQAAHDLTALKVPGAQVQRKRASIAWHVLDVPEGQRLPALDAAEAIAARRKLGVIRGRTSVEIRPPLAWDKGRAVQLMLQTRHGADWPAHVRALYIGDDATDEFAFRSLRGIGRSIRVAPPGDSTPTAADFTLPSPDDVIGLIRWLASGALRHVSK
jgi:trehalose 6-phosphate synthase/phosphatase